MDNQTSHPMAALLAPVLLFLIVNAWKVMAVDHAYELGQMGSLLPVLGTLPSYLILVTTFSLLVLLTRRPWIWVTVYLVQALFLLSHFAYFIYFKRPFYTRQFFLLFFEGYALVQSFDLPVTAQYLLVVADLPFFAWILLRRRALIQAVAHFKAKVVGLTVFLSVFSACFFGWNFSRLADSFWKDVHDYKKGDKAGVLEYGVLGIDLLDAYFFRDEKTIVSRFVYDPLQTHQAPRPITKKNIICVQIESLDAEVIQRKYNGRYIAPFLQKLSQECIHYPFMLYYIKAGSTSDAEFVALNSMMPLDNFPTLKLRGYGYPNSIARRLSAAGYDVEAFHNNEQEYFNRGNAFRQMGFPTFYDRRKMGLKQVGWGATDRSVLYYVMGMMRKQKAPFFDFVITMSSHHDFRRVRHYFSDANYDDMKDVLTRDYFNAVSYVDDVLKEFVTFVRRDFPDSYVVIYGDHGPYTIPPNPDFAPTQFTPLFIITPDGRRHFEKERVASAMDLSPTLLAASGIDFSLRTQGVNLLKFPITQNAIILPSGKMEDRRTLYAKAMQNRNGSSWELRPTKFVAEAGGDVAGLSGSNSLEALYASFDKGITLMELDFQWTSDDALVLTHDWDKSMTRLFNESPRVCSLNEFRKLRMVGGLHQLTVLNDLIPWLKSKPSVHIVTDIRTRRIEGLRQIYERHRHRFIPQISAFGEYNSVKSLGYPNIILSLADSAYSDQEVLEFVRKNPVWAVTMPAKRAAGPLSLELKKSGIFVYAQTVNDEPTARALEAKGVSGFYSDTLR